jgi:uncharacterized membrane protein
MLLGMNPEAPSAESLAELQQLQLHRQIAVGVALALLVLSLFWPLPFLGAIRAACWALAGILSLRETAKAKAIGVPGRGYGSAIIYFIVAVIPLLKGY